MLEQLLGKSFDDIGALMGAMKKLKVREKRYQSLHLFCRLTVKNYKAPRRVSFSERKWLMRKFEMVEFGHRMACGDGAFFNYAWLLRTLLLEADLSGHAYFVKRLRCKERLIHYSELLEQVRRAYTGVRGRGCASDSRVQPEQRSDGPVSHRNRKPSLVETCEARPRPCTRGRRCETLFGCEG